MGFGQVCQASTTANSLFLKQERRIITQFLLFCTIFCDVGEMPSENGDIFRLQTAYALQTTISSFFFGSLPILSRLKPNISRSGLATNTEE